MIVVNVAKGKCRWMAFYEPWSLSCSPTQSCIPTISRSWTGLTPGTPLDFCVTVGSDILCVSPKPEVGPSGSGSDTRDSAGLDCDGNSRSFSVGSPSCGLSASTSGTCSTCSVG